MYDFSLRTLNRQDSVEVISDVELCTKPDYFRPMRRRKLRLDEIKSFDCIVYRSNKLPRHSPENFDVSQFDWYRNRMVLQNGILLFYSLNTNYNISTRELKFNQAITKTKEVRVGSKGALLFSALGQNYLLRFQNRQERRTWLQHLQNIKDHGVFSKTNQNVKRKFVAISERNIFKSVKESIKKIRRRSSRIQLGVI